MARRNVTGRVTEPRAQKSPDIAAGARRMVIAGLHECDAWDWGKRQKRGRAIQRISESRPRSREVFVTGRVLCQLETFRFSADVLPLFATSSYSTTWPSLRLLRPALSTAE